MELIYLAFILFILGVGSTIVYDKYKDKITAKLKEVSTPRPKPVGAPQQTRTASRSQEQSLDDLLQNVRARARAGQTHVNVQQANSVQTMSVQELIKQLERMKKNL